MSALSEEADTEHRLCTGMSLLGMQLDHLHLKGFTSIEAKG